MSVLRSCITSLAVLQNANTFILVSLSKLTGPKIYKIYSLYAPCQIQDSNFIFSAKNYLFKPFIYDIRASTIYVLLSG